MISAWGVDHGEGVSKAFSTNGLGTKLMTSKPGMAIRNSKPMRANSQRQRRNGQDAARDTAWRMTGGERGAPASKSRNVWRFGGGSSERFGRQEASSRTFRTGAPDPWK